ncbi:hypothetical protein H8959_011747 [Pygathrix nigripes]
MALVVRKSLCVKWYLLYTDFPTVDIGHGIRLRAAGQGGGNRFQAGEEPVGKEPPTPRPPLQPPALAHLPPGLASLRVTVSSASCRLERAAHRDGTLTREPAGGRRRRRLGNRGLGSLGLMRGLATPPSAAQLTACRSLPAPGNFPGPAHPRPRPIKAPPLSCVLPQLPTLAVRAGSRLGPG